jgi:hypothetical protein
MILPALTPLPLHMTPCRRVSGNLALVKLINQENLMQEMNDTHPVPNIDCEFVAFEGFVARLPHRLELL